MKKNLSITAKVVYTLIFIFFVIYLISILLPALWLFLNTLKGDEEYYQRLFFPQGFEFINYVRAFEELTVSGNNVVVMLFNSLWYSVGGTFLGILVSTCLAYAVSKYRFFGRRILQALALITMVLPIVGALSAQYRLFTALGMINSPLILLCFTSGFGLNYWVMSATFDNLSFDYAEAAFLDGAGHFRVFFNVMLPQVIAPISALFIVSFIGIWNDYMSPLVFIPDYPTMAMGLYVYEAKNLHNYDMSMPIYFAGVFICIIPVLILFLIFQNSIMDISLSGGLKE